jgi:hypothetical protein
MTRLGIRRTETNTQGGAFHFNGRAFIEQKACSFPALAQKQLLTGSSELMYNTANGSLPQSRAFKWPGNSRSVVTVSLASSASTDPSIFDN